MKGWATFSGCETYRYTLGREWDPSLGRVCFCLLNPSTADEHVLDPTLTRCLGYAKRWGFGRMDVVNVFALRSTDPKGLRAVDDPIGPDNDDAIVEIASSADLVVAGWGTHASLMDRHDAALELLAPFDPCCWGLTKHGYPKHPLYLRADLDPIALEVASAS